MSVQTKLENGDLVFISNPREFQSAPVEALRINSTTGVVSLSDGSIATADVADLGVTTAKIAAAAVTSAKLAIAQSAVLVANGSAQNFSHGLGVVPSIIIITPLITSDGGHSLVQGTATTSVIPVTGTSGISYRVTCIA